MSRHLRHAPADAGLVLAPGGWVPVDELVAAAAHLGVTRDEVEAIVAADEKGRYSLRDGRIRANQGHSAAVDLELAPAEPPPVLYHGTGSGFVAAIRVEGLRRGQRHHVHLSADASTATRVGARHGRPVVLTVDAAGMRAEGVVFYRSENGVWLVDEVPPRFLAELPGADG